MKPTLSAVLVAALAALPVLSAPALAHDAAGLSIHDPYLRSSSAMSGAGFMMIENAGSTDCQLIDASTTAAGRAELHTHIDEDGMMKMVHVPEGFAIPAGGHFMLERGGPHVMLMDLSAPLEQGAEVELTLNFGDCGVIDVVVPVDNDRRPDDGDHDDHGDHGEHDTH